MTIKVIIMDLDGVITDTEPIHMEAWLNSLEKQGISFSEDEYKKNYLGLNDRDFLDAVGKVHGKFFEDSEKNDMIEEKTTTAISILERGVPVFSGVKEFVANASMKYLLSICSGAQKGEIEFIIKKLGWDKVFSPVIAAEHVKRGKPNPEGYIRAYDGLVERAGDVIFPENVLAVEDSPKGIRAAKEAGFWCLAVTNSFPREELLEADIVVSDISDFKIEDIGKKYKKRILFRKKFKKSSSAWLWSWFQKKVLGRSARRSV